MNDSKKLSPKKREQLDPLIKKQAISFSISVIDHDVIDQVNIRQATLLAMKKALEGLSFTPDHVLVDGETIPAIIHQTKIIKGDSQSASIAAASIIAKVYRDQLMNEYHEKFPYYNFKSNKGYGSKEHREALEIYGPCILHRRTFAPVSQMVAGG